MPKLCLHSLVFLFAVCVLCPYSPQQAWCQANDDTGKGTKILVLVRNGRGEPVSNLGKDDFIVTEHGVQDAVTEVERFLPTSPIVSQVSDRGLEPAGSGLSQPDRETAWSATTQVLLLIAPMSAAGRQRALADAIRFLSQPGAAAWRIALVDDAGNCVPYGTSVEQMQEILHKTVKRAYLPHGFTFWSVAHRAIGELGVLPGRHVVVVASDHGPTEFVDSALRAQAPIYAIQSTHPGVVVPFGGAAEEQFAGLGQDIANQIMDNTVQLGNLRSDFLYAADQTGGLAVADLKDAFHHIAADAAGYYVVSFRSHPDEANGTWNPVSVEMRQPHLHVKGPRYYVAPFESSAERIPEDLKKALKAGEQPLGLQVAAHAWLFPASDVHTGALAAELAWTDRQSMPAPGSRLRILAELINESTQGIAGSWYEERDWPSDGDLPLSIHWQREAIVFPGAYSLRVAGMDTASCKIATATFAFLARPLDAPALRFSAIVLSGDCLSATEQAKMRRNMFDPLMWEGCKLAPSASAHFKSHDNPTLLVRLFSPNEKLMKLITKKWKAYAVIDGGTGRENSVALSITPAEVRGLVVSGQLRFSEMHLSSGPHPLTVVFEFAGDGGKKRIPFHSKFTVEP